MRVLITGAAGFVGSHFLEAMRRVCPDDAELIPTAKNAGDDVEELDIVDRSAIGAAVAHYRPSHVMHLAGIAALPAAASAPDVTWNVHVDGTLNLARAILEHVPDCSLINAGSGLIYGASAKSGLPLDENTLLAPVDDYGASKAAAD
ncbi:NAD-dependent epimerase/dehydratase family protein, partial [Microbacteriaceae bacterium K1510]|nr:NAD-dependent epimerase/dehydratase family protein [Microbacteriaceae bacterium K1510]